MIRFRASVRLLAAAVAVSLVWTSLAGAQDRGNPPPPVKRDIPPAVDRGNPPAAPAARGNAAPAAGERGSAVTASGKVVASEPDKSITLEVASRDGQTSKVEFIIMKDKTKLESRGQAVTIQVGSNVTVVADKDNPKLAVLIMPGGTGTR
jgi:hypothetical protein